MKNEQIEKNKLWWLSWTILVICIIITLSVYLINHQKINSSTSPDFYIFYQSTDSFVILTGLIVSFLLWLIIYLLVNTRYQALKLAQKKTLELKISNDFLMESEQKYRTLFERSAEGILVADIESKKFKFANPAICKILGYSEEELKNLSVMDIHPKESLDLIIAEFEAQARGEKQLALNIPVLRKDHTIKYTDICTANAVIEGKDCNIGFFTDITERKLSEEAQKKFELQLQQTQKMEAISTLAGGIAHDFNNMLGVIIGNLSYASSITKNNTELSEIIEDSLDGAKKSQSLTQQLLTFSKGGEPVKKNTDLNPILIESSNFVIRGSKVRCEFNLDKNLWSLDIDEGQIYQVVSNLVINSIQAMPGGGIVEIHSSNVTFEPQNSTEPLPPGNYIKIDIKDYGIGIPKKFINKIFDPFYTTKQTGNGIGLSTVYSIIQKHNGLIYVHSIENEGTTFTIYLPANNKDKVFTEKKQNSNSMGNAKILIMDDQEPILKMIDRMLKRLGCETVLAKDGAQAVSVYSENLKSGKPIDLVILDLTIPGGMGGAETMKELLKIDSNVKAIVSSGYSNDPIMANYKDYGFCGIIPKPYTKNQLTEVLNKIFCIKS